MRACALQFVVGAGIVLLPSLALTSHTLYYNPDALNHQWMILHGADALSHDHQPPWALNTTELGGVPFPVFYGYLFYPIMNGLAAAVGARNAIRLAVIGIFALQYLFVHRAARAGGASNSLATVMAALVSWAIYPLTNLYHRGAYPEFFATALLTGAVCRWFAFLDADTARTRFRTALEVGLLYALAAGCHPIIALYGLVFMAALSLTLWTRAAAGKRLLSLLFAAIFVVLLLAPWVYACSQFNDKLSIRGTKLLLFPDDIDCWWVRLFPLPLDIRGWTNLEQHPGPVSTPHLDAQINIPLLLLAAGIGWSTLRVGGKARLWLLLPLVMGGMTLWMSLRVWPYYAMLPPVFRVVQFPYRMVTFVNLSMLVAVLLALRIPVRGELANRTPLSDQVRLSLCICAMTLSLAGVLLKLVSVQNAIGPVKLESRQLPLYFYGWFGYATPGQYPALTSEEEAKLKRVLLEMPPGGSLSYQSTTVEAAEPAYVAVQVQAFPWNHLYIDGRRVPDAELRVWKGYDETPWVEWHRGPYLAAPVPAGSHVIEHRFEPDRVWVVMYWVSLASLLGSAVVVVVLRTWDHFHEPDA